MYFEFEIQETLRRVVGADAQTQDEAREMVIRSYLNAEIVLSVDDHVSTEISPLPPVTQ